MDALANLGRRALDRGELGETHGVRPHITAVVDLDDLPGTTPELVRDTHCQTPGCNRPPDQCEAHHIIHWERGGPTSLENLRLRCWSHHRQRHTHDAQARAD